MRDRTPVPRDERAALPDFAPVPRLKHRHDGWTPERQRAFIEALADTGSVSRAAASVNMAQANCYTLRRAPGAESFRQAWNAALDCGVARLKDIALERAIDGQLVPVFKAGKLAGFSRKRNDALLMFCLRHYGQDAGGRRTTINYFSTRASAGVAGGGVGGGGEAAAEASTTTVRTTISGEPGAPDALAREGDAAARIEAFAGVALDAEAGAAIAAALEACAARRREADATIEAGGDAALAVQAADPDEPFVRPDKACLDWHGDFEPPARMTEWVPFADGESPWEMAGADLPDWAAAAREMLSEEPAPDAAPEPAPEAAPREPMPPTDRGEATDGTGRRRRRKTPAARTG
ncbi:hypothetical protein [uncultured Sphingomonas sp.]|uniref:hypothetical protein n=1 Tax=uncultured Sphingomonas sp. TaxID=158754 RepID=UPI0035CA2794